MLIDKIAVLQKAFLSFVNDLMIQKLKLNVNDLLIQICKRCIDIYQLVISDKQLVVNHSSLIVNHSLPVLFSLFLLISLQ
jgi:hypothetical protein